MSETLDNLLPTMTTASKEEGVLREDGGLNALLPTMTTASKEEGVLREDGGLNALLPSGGWTLYFHPAKETRWHMDTYKKVCQVKTYREVAQMFAAVTSTDWARGKFFFCPDGIPPLMENAKNIRGGAYSLRVDRAIAGDVMNRYILAAAIGKLMKEPGNLVSCVRITPRRDFNILQVWNRDCQTHNLPTGMNQPDSRIALGEVQYKPHVEKKI